MKKLILILFFISSLFGQDDLWEAARDGTLSQSQINELISKCNSGDGVSCRNIGIFYSNKDFENHDAKLEALSFEYYAKGCNLKNGGACSSLGGIYHRGEGVAQDITKALEYYTKGCDYNGSLGCYWLGDFYAQESKAKSGAEKKAAELKAKQYYKKGCDLGYKLSCSNLKDL